MATPTFSDTSDVRLGFEVECLLNRGTYEKFYREMGNLYVEIGNDGSINNTNPILYITAELRTRPLPPKKAMQLLNEIFELLKTYGSTNNTCGLHVNISSKKEEKMMNFNPLCFLSSSIWEEILTTFQRQENAYCKSIIPKSAIKYSKLALIQNMVNVFVDKYRCVNFINFGNGEDSRIEVRGFGNQNYHFKYELIASFVKRIERLFNFSCQNKPLTRLLEV